MAKLIGVVIYDNVVVVMGGVFKMKPKKDSTIQFAITTEKDDAFATLLVKGNDVILKKHGFRDIHLCPCVALLDGEYCLSKGEIVRNPEE